MALALAGETGLRITGGSNYIENNPAYKPVFADLCRITAGLCAGDLRTDGADLVFEPRNPGFGVRDIAGTEFSSLSDIILFLLPVLSRCEFRSILNCKGVTHGPLCLPTSVLKETLFGLIERTGVYAGLKLNRFGFYGSGQGSAEVRVYPSETPGFRGWVPVSRCISGAKIFVAHMNREIALRQREVIQNDLGLQENRIAVIEVIDAAGYGNSVQVFMEGSLNGEQMTVVLSREMDVYDISGSIIYDLDASLDRVKDLTDECRNYIEKGIFPDVIISELLPFTALAGIEPPVSEESPLLKGTSRVIQSLL